MEVKRTVILARRDRQRTGEIINIMRERGYLSCGMKMIKLTQKQVEDYCAPEKGSYFYTYLLKYMAAAPFVAMCWEGKYGMVTKTKWLIKDEKKETGELVRSESQWEWIVRNNWLYASDNEEDAKRDLQRYFKPEELFDETPFDPYGRERFRS